MLTETLGYDAFGNVRSSQGGANAAAIGDDFRFQGQWLDQGTGLYNFRARDYDSRTRIFLSRDPVDSLQYEPENFNPYQLACNNPQLYSDPSGVVSLIEINASLTTQDSLRTNQSYVINQAKQYVIDQAKGVVCNKLLTALSSLLPNR